MDDSYKEYLMIDKISALFTVLFLKIVFCL